MTETGIWSPQEAKHHQFSPKLAEWIKNYLDPSDIVYDFGCGKGTYLDYLRMSDKEFAVHGFEGTKHIRFDLPDHLISHIDLTQPFEPNGLASVISLEVGEHLPKWAEQTFIDTITKSCSCDLIISWALPFQTGIGHVNCQPKEYIIAEIEKRGFNFLPEITEDARKNVDDNTDWFRRTLLVFKSVE